MIRKWLARIAAQGSATVSQATEQLVAEGDAAFLRDDFPVAEAAYRQAIAEAPNLVPAYLGLGAVLRAMGRFDEAVGTLTALLKIDADVAGAYELLAACHLAMSDMASAEEPLRRAVKLRPGTESNYIDLGAVLINQKRYTEASALLEQAIAGNPGFVNLQLQLANLRHETGDLDQAAAVYRAILRLMPDHALALYNLGLVMMKAGELDAAADAIKRALELHPQWADACNNLAWIYLRLGRHADAQASIDQALALAPGMAQAHFNAGELALAGADASKALAHYRRAIEIDPDLARAHLQLALVLEALGQHSDAAAHLEHGLEIEPDNHQAMLQLAKLHQASNQHQRALVRYREVLAAVPDHVEALLGLASTLQTLAESGDAASRTVLLEDAAEACRAVLAREPQHVPARLALGALLGQTGKFDAADEQFQAVLLSDPNNPNARHNLGVSMESRARQAPAAEKRALFEQALVHYAIVLTAVPDHIDALMGVAAIHVDQLQNELAAASYERILHIDPSYAPARMSYAMLKLKLGDFASGWREFESRWDVGDQYARIRLRSDKPQWNGTADLTGKTIILYHEQGLGDSLQFIRYAGLLRACGAIVVVKAPLALQTLFANNPDIHQVFDGDDIPEHDFHCSLLSLPWMLKTELETVPAVVPYLQARPERIAYWREKLGKHETLCVGLVWAGDPRLQDDSMRSIHLDCLRSLFDIPGISFFSLQVGAAAAQLQDAPQIMGVAGELTDFEETAALAANLDLAICVDTSSAHLFGATGRPVWLLNRFNTCWRWMLERQDSPWYPTMRIFRQPSLGDWDSVISEVKRELEDLASSRPQA